MGIYSGKFVLRLSADKHARLKRGAFQEGVSLNSYCDDLLDYALKNKKVDPQQKRFKVLVEKAGNYWGSEVCGIVLFGSAVKGERFDTSDIDILVVMEKDVAITRQFYKIWDEQIEDHKTPVINPHFVNLVGQNPPFGSLWLEVAKNHEILWQKGQKIEQALAFVFDLILKNKVELDQSAGIDYWRWN